MTAATTLARAATRSMRIVAIPLIVAVFYLPLEGSTRNLIATVLFVVFALTDWLDGWLARKLHQTIAGVAADIEALAFNKAVEEEGNPSGRKDSAAEASQEKHVETAAS